MVKDFYEIKECRICGSENLTRVIELGDQYVSDFLDTPSNDGVLAPLTVVRCRHCGLVQLQHTVNRDLLYKHYWYESGINENMRESLKQLVRGAEIHANLMEGDWVMDIGSNDGTTLNFFNSNITTVGVEPATNLVSKCKNIDYIINDYFKPNMPFPDGRFNAILSVAMFYDLEKPNEFLQEVRRLLAPDGVFIIQMNDLYDMIKNNTFDNIGHEHLEYYSFTTLEYLLLTNGLQTFHVEFNQVNGGSMRAYIQHRGGYQWKRVSVLEALRMEVGMDEILLKRYRIAISEMSIRLNRFIDHEIKRGKKFYGYGASNRGNTILQYMGLDSTRIKAIADRNPAKWGKFTPTGIPITSEEQMRRDNPDYLFVLPYHFIDSFVQRESEYLKNGGKMLVPIPLPRIISGEGNVVDYI